LLLLDASSVTADASASVKRLGSRYRSGHSRDWLKSKNPEAPAMKREKEEDWGKGSALIRSRVNAGAKNRPPKGKGRPGLGSLDKGWCRHEQGLNDSESSWARNCDFFPESAMVSGVY
jgi:hypothetical protein